VEPPAAPKPEPEPEPEPEPPRKPEVVAPAPSADTSAPAANESAAIEATSPDEDDGTTPGGYLRELRRGRGISLRELSLRTKIGLKYLEAIESVDTAIMPRPVYLRGYLREIAQVFDIDETELIDRYFGHLGHS
jgi:hypothetical protein